MRDYTLGFVVVILFVIGIVMIIANEPSVNTVVFGMFLIAVSLVTASYVVNFPAKKPRIRKRPGKKKK